MRRNTRQAARRAADFLLNTMRRQTELCCGDSAMATRRSRDARRLCILRAGPARSLREHVRVPLSRRRDRALREKQREFLEDEARRILRFGARRRFAADADQRRLRWRGALRQLGRADESAAASPHHRAGRLRNLRAQTDRRVSGSDGSLRRPGMPQMLAAWSSIWRRRGKSWWRATLPASMMRLLWKNFDPNRILLHADARLAGFQPRWRT